MSNTLPVGPSAIVHDVQVKREQLKQLFDQPDLLPEKLLSFLVDYIAVNMLPVPASTVVATSSTIFGTITGAGAISAGTGF